MVLPAPAGPRVPALVVLVVKARTTRFQKKDCEAMQGFLSIFLRAVDLAGALFFLVVGVVGMFEWLAILYTMPLPADDRNLAIGVLLVAVVFAAVGASWLRGWLRAPKL